MTHTFEFVAKIADGRIVHMHYKGETSRKSKVTRKILEDLKRAYNIEANQVNELFLKPVI